VAVVVPVMYDVLAGCTLVYVMLIVVTYEETTVVVAVAKGKTSQYSFWTSRRTPKLGGFNQYVLVVVCATPAPAPNGAELPYWVAVTVEAGKVETEVVVWVRTVVVVMILVDA
jgi:hypothetical protein